MAGDGPEYAGSEGEMGDALATGDLLGQVEDGASGGEAPAPLGKSRSAADEKRFVAFEAQRQAAEAAGDTAGEAAALCKLAKLHEKLGATEAARDALTRARFLYEMGGDVAGAVGVVMLLGDMEARLRRSEGAARLYHEASDLYMRLDAPDRAADALLSEADVLTKMGRQDTAVDRVEAAEALFARLDHTLGQAHTAYRMALLLLAEEPEAADEKLELAARLFGDHVSRDVEQIDVALPETVTDSRRYPPFVMQRICLRERQKLGGPRAAPMVGRPGARRARGDGELAAATSDASHLTTWIGLVLLVGGFLALLGPQLVTEGGPLQAVADALGGVVSAAGLLHLAIGLCGAIAATVAARQSGISAPVVLLALAIGVGMIFHEVGRALLPGPSDLQSDEVPAAFLIESEAKRLARTEGANYILKARKAAAAGNLEAARASFAEAYEVAREIVDTKGQVRALEALLATEVEYGTAADQLAAAERLYDDLRGLDDERGREVLEQVVDLASRLDDRARLREAQVKLLSYHERVGDTPGEVKALLALAAIDREAGDLEASYEWFRRAHAGYQMMRDAQGQIGTLLAMGEIDARLGRRRRAYAAFRQAERLYNQVGDTAGEALAALRFGSTQVAHGNQRQAREGFLRSLELYRSMDDTGGQARAHLGLGSHWLKVGDRAESTRHYELARALYQRLGDATGQLAALREMAIVAHESGSAATAGSRLEEARRVTREVVDPAIRAGLLLSAGDLALSLERPDVARDTYREALALYEALGDDPGRRAADERLARMSSAG